VRAAFLAAIEAARDRGRELGADPAAAGPPDAASTGRQ